MIKELLNSEESSTSLVPNVEEPSEIIEKEEAPRNLGTQKKESNMEIVSLGLAYGRPRRVIKKPSYFSL